MRNATTSSTSGIRFQRRLLVFVPLLISSCSITKYVPEGDYLLDKNIIKITEKNIVADEEIAPYVRQRPNRTGLFNIKFHLMEYSLSGKDTTKWHNRTLRSWGEPPVIFDSSSVRYSIQNIRAYMRQRGYYFAEVSDSVIVGKKKAKVTYTVKPGNPYRFRNIYYDIRDTALHRIVASDSSASLLRPRRRLSSELLDSERDRIASLVRNRGYYSFNKGYISYEADTSNGNMTADVKISVAQMRGEEVDGRVEYLDHPVYRINKVYIYTDYDAVAAISDSSYAKELDTLYSRGIHILYKETQNLKPGVLSRVNLINEEAIYREEDATKTYNNLSNLNMFKSITIHFNRAAREGRYLDCVILLNPNPSQSYKTDMEVSTNSSDMVGFSPGVHYGHRNLCGGAENFSLDFRGVFQYSFPTSDYQNSQEYNIASSINLPRFLMPISIPYFKTQLPHTRFTVSYTYQQRPDYIRAMANFRFGYSWKSSSYKSYILNPVEFSMIKMYDLSEWFYDGLDNAYLKNTYADHFILGLTGSYIYNTQQSETRLFSSGYRRRRNSFHYYRINGDIGGNLLSAFNSLLKTNAENGGREIWGMPYAQYAKADINVVFNNPIRDLSTLVWRFFFGIGKAYGNSKSLPFEKMYYSGGANSLRGWQVRAVGPGSVSADSVANIPNQVADMHMEMNLEYRFPIIWKLEGAWFADAGNIWSISSKDLREGATFSLKRFYKEIAVDTGLGARLNFGYLVLRLDMGYKVYNPGLPEGQRIIFPNRWFRGKNFGLHFGINYPF